MLIVPYFKNISWTKNWKLIISRLFDILTKSKFEIVLLRNKYDSLSWKEYLQT